MVGVDVVGVDVVDVVSICSVVEGDVLATMVDEVSSFEPHADNAMAAAKPVNDAVTERVMSDLDV